MKKTKLKYKLHGVPNATPEGDAWGFTISRGKFEGVVVNLKEFITDENNNISLEYFIIHKPMLYGDKKLVKLEETINLIIKDIIKKAVKEFGKK
jgi:hypothetical protein